MPKLIRQKNLLPDSSAIELLIICIAVNKQQLVMFEFFKKNQRKKISRNNFTN